MIDSWRQSLFETLYKNRYLYQFASTVPFAGQWRTWQRLVLSRLHGHSVLELGCGLGDLLADMIEAGYDCRAVEISPEMLAAARSTLQQRHCGQLNWVVQGQAQRLAFEDASFDNVVSTFPSEYIYAPNTICEINRVLRPDGRLIIIVGANLLKVDPIQMFMLLTQACVNESTVLFGHSKEENRRNKVESNQYGIYPEFWLGQDTDITTEVVPNGEFGKLIPLEQYGLRRRCERVCSNYWEAYIVVGEK